MREDATAGLAIVGGDYNERHALVTLNAVLEEVRTRRSSGDLAGALNLLAQSATVFDVDPAFIKVAVDAWVAAIDQTGIMQEWRVEGRESLERALIVAKQETAPPFLHHRIAAQHSSGIKDHLARAATAIGPTLAQMLRADEVPVTVTLLALLLRDNLGGSLQERISELHQQQFPQFSEAELSIPYNIIFDREHFRSNIEDLRELVVASRSTLSTDLPLPQTLLLCWLFPDEFVPPAGMKLVRLIGRESLQKGDTEKNAAARSLIVRGGLTDAGSLALVAPAAEDAMRLADAALAVHPGPDLSHRDSANDGATRRLRRKPVQAVAIAWNVLGACGPALRWGRRPKVAVCISGQLRGYKAAFASWRPFLAHADARLFVSGWKAIGRGTPEPFRSKLPFDGKAFTAFYREIGNEIGLSGLRELYPTLFRVLEQSSETSVSELRTFYGTQHVQLFDECDSQFAGFNNSAKMHWQIERCYDAAINGGEEWDLIVRIRPDKPIRAAAFFWSDLWRACQARPLIFSETAMGVHYGGLLMGDQFAVGAPDAMRIYSRTFSRHSTLRELGLYKYGRELTGHASLAQACWLNRISVERAPVKFGPLNEIEPIAMRTIFHALEGDCSGRANECDRRMLAAIAADMRRGA